MSEELTKQIEEIAENLKSDPSPKSRTQQRPGAVLRKIGEKFNDLRRRSMTEAYGYMQSALMENVHVLVPTVIPLKDFLAMIQELENFLKGKSSNPSESADACLQRWLNASDEELVN